MSEESDPIVTDTSDQDMPALAASASQGLSFLDRGSAGADAEPPDFSLAHLPEEDPVEAFFLRDEARFWAQQAEERHEVEPPQEGAATEIQLILFLQQLQQQELDYGHTSTACDAHIENRCPHTWRREEVIWERSCYAAVCFGQKTHGMNLCAGTRSIRLLLCVHPIFCSSSTERVQI